MAERTHGPALSRVLEERQNESGGALVLEIPAAMPRKDQQGAETKLGIFDEAKAFSGLHRLGEAVVGATVVASPHTTRGHELIDFMRAANIYLEQEVEVPKPIRDAGKVADHLVVWSYQNESGEQGRTDPTYLASKEVTRDEIQNIAVAEAKMIGRAVSILRAVDEEAASQGKYPVIWRGFGHGTIEETREMGMGRGTPSNPNGHTHIVWLTDEREAKATNDLTPSEKLKHFAPWNRLLYERLGDTISERIARTIDVSTAVSSYSSDHQSEYGTKTWSEGYKVQFDTAQEYSRVAEEVMNVAIDLEETYQALISLYKNYIKVAPGEEATEYLCQSIEEMNFTSEAAKEIATFMAAMQPTFGMLQKVHEELSQSHAGGIDVARIEKKLQSYEKIYQRLSGYEGDDLMLHLMRSTVAPPASSGIEGTWPVHFGGAIVIDDYESEPDGRLMVRSFDIIPSIGVNKGVEHVTGSVLRRA